MSETPDSDSLVQAPGQILKRAREGKNLTVAAIATLMNLDLRTIEALERGDQDKLPAPIFVRGYLRGYARLVGVAEAVVLEAYSAQAPQEPLPRSVGMSRVPVRPAFRAPAIPLKGLLWVIVLLIAGWFGVQWGPELVARLNDSVATDIAETALPAAQQADAEVPAEPAVDELADSAATPAEDVELTAGTSVLLELPAPGPAPATEPPQAVEVVEPLLLEEADVVASTAGNDSPDATPAAPATPAPGPDELSIAFRMSGDSWVEVHAADKKKLIIGLLRKGDSRAVTGKAPLRVVLGNAAGVEVTVNGAPFDHNKYVRDNIARFEVKR